MSPSSSRHQTTPLLVSSSPLFPSPVTRESVTLPPALLTLFPFSSPGSLIYRLSSLSPISSISLSTHPFPSAFKLSTLKKIKSLLNPYCLISSPLRTKLPERRVTIPTLSPLPRPSPTRLSTLQQHCRCTCPAAKFRGHFLVCFRLDPLHHLTLCAISAETPRSAGSSLFCLSFPSRCRSSSSPA